MPNPNRGVYTRYIPGNSILPPPKYISPTACDKNQRNSLIPELAQDIVVDREKVTDGASDIGWVDAAKMGLCPELEPGEVKMYAARRFRGIIPLDDGRCTLAKGMLFMTPCEKGGSACEKAAAKSSGHRTPTANSLTPSTSRRRTEASRGVDLQKQGHSYHHGYMVISQLLGRGWVSHTFFSNSQLMSSHASEDTS